MYKLASGNREDEGPGPQLCLVAQNWQDHWGLCTLTQHRSETSQAPVHAWESLHAQWLRLYINFAGLFWGQVFLIIVDAFSKWLEMVPVSSITSFTCLPLMGCLMQLFPTTAPNSPSRNSRYSLKTMPLTTSCQHLSIHQQCGTYDESL